MVPVAIVAGQSRRFHRQYGADSAITDRRQKPTETRPLVMAGPRNVEIVINDDHLREAQLPRAILQCILTTTAFQVVPHLLQARLSNIDVRGAFQMLGIDLIVHRNPLLKNYS
jgi:hypothetical protein